MAPCIVCGALTIEVPGSYEICPNCYWEDDPVQAESPNSPTGSNHLSLNEARNNYRRFGVVEEKFIFHVRSA